MKNLKKEANLKIKKEIINTIGDIIVKISDVKKMQANKDVEGLIRALKDKDYDVRKGVIGALGKIGDAMAVEPLIEALKDENSKKLQFGASHRVVHKRSTSQNMPIW
jgi:HEAT repeat protein